MIIIGTFWTCAYQSALENIDHSQKFTEKGILRSVFHQAFSKLVSNFEEANKKLIIA
jgi:hypothetical protein